jgi:DNA-binding NtrC family response regulator
MTSLNPLRVLLVDDDVLGARALARMIESCGHCVTVLTSPTEALRMARKDSVDVLIADNHMPGLTGTELLAMLARLQPSTFRVLTTASLAPDRVAMTINQSRLEYLLLKPFRLDDVRALVATAQSERRVAAVAQRPIARELPALSA